MDSSIDSSKLFINRSWILKHWNYPNMQTFKQYMSKIIVH